MSLGGRLSLEGGGGGRLGNRLGSSLVGNGPFVGLRGFGHSIWLRSARRSRNIVGGVVAGSSQATNRRGFAVVGRIVHGTAHAEGNHRLCLGSGRLGSIGGLGEEGVLQSRDVQVNKGRQKDIQLMKEKPYQRHFLGLFKPVVDLCFGHQTREMLHRAAVIVIALLAAASISGAVLLESDLGSGRHRE